MTEYTGTTARPWPVHADRDKPHRCPACWRVAVQDDFLPWVMYTCCGCADPGCGCGQQFSARPWLPGISGEPGHPIRNTRHCAARSLAMTVWRLRKTMQRAGRYVTQ
jgi:hypothetical protein